MQKARPLEILTDDRVALSATLYTQEEKSPHLIIMGPATAAPQHYYKRFAEYAGRYRDFDVITFDYRGTGQSLRGPLKANKAMMSEWGSHDMKAVINWADSRYEKIFLLGHSVAGQVFPKAANSQRITAAYFVGSQSAYFGHWSGIYFLQVLFFWLVALPLSCLILGYMPGWAMGGKVGLPKKAALEWRKWGLHPQGVLQGNPETIRQFAEIRIPVHFVNMQDDRLLAPAAATQALMHCYPNAVTSFQSISPRQLDLEGVGHFGFFKSKYQEKLWSMPMFFFRQFVTKIG